MNAELTEQLILVVHLLLALAIIGLIMLQQGKGADMGASFGAGASQTLFGSSGGGNVLTKTTAWMVALFFATSFGLAVIAKNKTTSVDEFDLPIPEAAAEQAPSTVDELPSIDVPEMPSSDIPALQGEELGVDLESDLPEL
ncbi:MAG: preprotein translocase subunit SecG [Pseudomonadota bacterium]